METFKKLENIVSSYIGGNSTTYESLSDNLFDVCDIITCGFAYPASDGTFTESTVNSYNFTYYLPKMKQYVIPKAHEQGTWVVLSICGVSGIYDTALETIVPNDELLDIFIANIIDLINEYGFDGVDIDWETPSDGALFTKLMKKLYEAVKANNENHLVTAAIPGGTWQTDKYELDVSSSYIDYINMMSYNMATNNGYHHTPLYKSSSFDDTTNSVGKTLSSCSIEESVEIYQSYSVPLEKIIIGAGFYGILQTRENTSSAWESTSNPSYNEIYNNYLTNSNYKQCYDNNAQAAYLISNDGLTFISYDNETSIAAKCEYAIGNQLGGIFAWHYGLDNGDLINSFKVNMNK